MQPSNRKFLKNFVGFSMVSWISFLLGFVATPLSTRLFAPDELAKVNLFGTYTSLICSVCYLGLDQAFVRFYKERPPGVSQRGLLTFCLGVALGACALLGAAGSLFWAPVSEQIAGAPDAWVYACLCLYSLSLVAFRFLSLSYRMEQNPLPYTVQGVSQAALTKIAYLGVGFIAASGRAAIVSLTGLMLPFAALTAWIQRKRLDVHARPNPACVRELARFSLPLMPLSLLSWLNSSVSTLALRQLLGMEATGVYTSALALASTINIVQTGFNTYWSPYVLDNYQSDESARFDAVHRSMACLLTFLGLGLTLLQSPVFLLLGRSYRSSVVYFPFLFLSPICYCLGETTGMGILISKKSYWTTLIYLLSALVNIALCYALIPALGMTGAAMASALTAVLTLALRTAVGEHYYRAIRGYRALGGGVGLMLLASVANWLLTGAQKYAAIAVCLLLAVAVFAKELKTLGRAAGQLLSAAQGRLRRRAHQRRKP